MENDEDDMDQGRDGRKDKIDDEEPLILGTQESMKDASKK